MPNTFDYEWGFALLIISSSCLRLTPLKKLLRLKDMFIVFNGPKVCLADTLVALELVKLLISLMRQRTFIEFSNSADFKSPQLL